MRGIIHTIEASIGGILLLGFLIFLSGLISAYTQRETGPDAQTLLNDAVKLGARTPEDVMAVISLYGYNITACWGCKIDAEEVWTGSYLLAKDDGWKELKLYIWR
ncbi:MAG: hypothetical protein QXP39_02510 [Candidatus Aenigmatarchaeota archaeon]